MNSPLARPIFPASSGNTAIPRNFWMTAAPLLKALSWAALLLLVGLAIQSPVGFRAVASLSVLLLLLVLLWKFPSAGVPAIFVFLVFLGGIRRWIIPDFGWLSFDLLLTIGPVISLLFFIYLLMTRRLPTDTPLSKFIKYLLIVMALQIVNPLQGGLLVGVGGIIYYICPLLWFYLGRTYGKHEMTLNIFKFSVLVYFITGIYGLKQVFFGISASEKQWVDLSGYAALKISDATIRVFSTFASTQEYASTLACAICICAALVISKKRAFILPLFVLVPALFYTGTRGPIVGALFTICILWAIIGRGRAAWLPRLGLSLVIGIIGMAWSLNSVKTETMSQGQKEILAHQQNGLLDPTKSTGPAHFVAIFDGIFRGVKQPLGYGLGSTTLAAGKLGGGDIYSSEVDLSNLFISLGIIGGTLYALVIFHVFKSTFELWNRNRDIVTLVIIAFLLANIGQWLNGGLYSLCFLSWFAIGVIDRNFSFQQTANLLRSASPSAPSASSSAQHALMQRRPGRSARRPTMKRTPQRAPSLSSANRAESKLSL